ncbi:L,D-transpeptidase [Alsobacter sp. R-9]
MNKTLLLGLMAAALAAAAPAAAQTRPNLGGGFIELLMTGRDPTPSRGASPATGMMQAPSAPATVSTAALAGPATRIPSGSGQIEQAFDPKFARQRVDFEGTYAPGTILIDIEEKFLFLILPGGQAIRYGIGVGRPGFLWTGTKNVTRKAEWPDWTPPPEMLKRRPDLPRFMEGGPDNPLGARALYLGSSLYRIHGTNEPNTIGTNVSSGCIRMLNEDVIDLYNRVKVGTRVVVI